jgi:class 3 adenylate cyclase
MTDTGADRDRPSLVTVLFVDVVGSTELRSRLGDARADMIQHEIDELTRSSVEAAGGWVVKNLGDGSLAAFAGAADAIEAAVGMQQALSRLGPSLDHPVSVRVGLGAGDVAWTDDDCHGTPVVEAARVCDHAGPGQILATDIVRALAGSRAPVPVEPRGEIELKGLDEPVSICEVSWQSVADRDQPPIPAALQLGADTPFVGRANARHQLSTAWKLAVQGRFSVQLVVGEPGIGKTRLAAELATVAHENGGRVLYGRCDDETGVPFQPFVEALRGFIRDLDPSGLQSTLGPHAAELTRLAPELVELAGLVAPDREAPELERYRLVTAVTEWLRTAGRERPILLVLDDIHWAGKPTLLLLRQLARNLQDGRALIIATYRDTDVDRSHPLGEVLGDLRREETVGRLSLAGLDPEEVVEMMGRIAGHDLDAAGLELASVLHTETEGNPFFVREVLFHLAESGALYERDGRWVSDLTIDELGIPEGVKEVVGRRLSRMGELVNRTLTHASVIGRDFPVDVLSQVVDQDPDELARSLERAERAQLIQEVSSIPLVYRFSHALVQGTLYDEIGTAHRVRMHGRVGEAIEELRSGRIEEHLGEVATHYGHAAVGGHVSRAVEWAERAGRAARMRLAHEEAVEWYRRALTLLELEETGDTERRCDLMIRLGTSQFVAGDAAHHQTLERAAELAHRLDDGERLALALLGNNRGLPNSTGDEIAERRVELLEHALRLLPPDSHRRRAMILAELSLERSGMWDDTRGREIVDHAIEEARRSGDDVTLVRTLVSAGFSSYSTHDLSERVAIVDEAVTKADELDHPLLQAASRAMAIAPYGHLGDIDTQERLATELTELADRLQIPLFHWFDTGNRVALTAARGRFDEARSLIERSFEWGTQAGQTDVRAQQASQHLVVENYRGNALTAITEKLDSMRWGRPVWIARTEGRPVRELVDVALTARWGRGTFQVLIDDILDSPDPDAARVMLESTGITDHPFLFTPMAPSPPSAWYTGVLRGVLGDHDRADADMAAAFDLESSRDVPPLLARVRIDWAGVKLDRKGVGDSEAARELLHAARAVTVPGDMPGLTARAETLEARIDSR